MPPSSVTADFPGRAYVPPQVRRTGVPQAVRAAEWLVVLALAAYIGGRALPRAWQRVNTDFPNYYITARLLREGYSTTRLYEWIWLQRQKTRMGITRSDQPVVGFVPDTPFSSLLVWPLTFWSPLVAKRIWIIINLLLLAEVAILLRAITHLEWRWLALLIGLCYPLLRNFEYGQYYLVLLLVITAALWSYVQGRRFLAGALIGVAAGIKIFPALFFLYFARKRDAHAAIGAIAGATFTVLASLAAFGPQLHRIYLTQVLPWALRGEALDPYNLGSNSLSSLLHKLFLLEPEWNPHPALHSAAAFAVLHPLLQLLIFLPAIYFAIPGQKDSRRVQLEFSAFLVALLAISTLPASYHFTVLILPVTILAAHYLREREYASLALLLMLYVAICFPAWPHGRSDGWWALSGVPRLYFILLLCTLCYATLFRLRSASTERRAARWAWAAALAIALVVEVTATLREQRGIYSEYRGRIITSPDILLASAPMTYSGQVGFIAMRTNGYSAGIVNGSGVHLSDHPADQLSQTTDGRTIWIEQSGTQPGIVRKESSLDPIKPEVSEGEFPVASPDGRWLAYLHSDRGRSTLRLRTVLDPVQTDVAVTPPQFDVEEMTFLPGGVLVFAAMNNHDNSALYLAAQDGGIQPLGVGDARYPAASPDGRWLAYSHLQQGIWNLWLRDLQTGKARRVTDAACNDISPAWQDDSKTLLYASDCGRALWFTALYRMEVVP